MTKHRALIVASILVAGVVLPSAGRAQDPGQGTQQQQQPAQLQQLQQSIDQQQQQLQEMQREMQMQAQAEWAVHHHRILVPEHLQIGDRQYDASVSGIREYVETLKTTNPTLYGQLAPDVAGLEAKRDMAGVAVVGGLAVGLATAIYGAASRETCTGPAITDPNFGADVAAWGACNDRNMNRLETYSLLSGGAVLMGALIAFAVWPGRQDIVELVNKHNRLSKQPLQLQIGYDPTQRFAFSGASVAF